MQLEKLIIFLSVFASAKMELLEVRGKSTRKLRKVFILYSPVTTKRVNHLLATRFHAGVALTNKYVFSRTTYLPIDVCTAMRQVTPISQGLSSPHFITTRLLR